ncbi:sperm-associated antigen 16 protein-like [Oscarella lobularis]|uniref:sperm-associated antigen 16 protein-like n=1 Tax=Oscarella lobularis TaxID=121494 RepID=UPI003313B6E9
MSTEDLFYLERVDLEEDVDEELNFEEVPIEDFAPLSDDENLETIVRCAREAARHDRAASKCKIDRVPAASVVQRPEVVDDFVRNFLVKMKMFRTLDCFQNEWYELQERGLLSNEDVRVVPDVYAQNQQLDNEIKDLHKDLSKLKSAANEAKEMYIKLKKERDFHRMHHKRVTQEKNKLIVDMKRLRQHYAMYEPTLKQLKNQYESALREKMLTKLERDKAVSQIIGLQTTLKQIGSSGNEERSKREKPVPFAEKSKPLSPVLPTKDKEIDFPVVAASSSKRAVNFPLPSSQLTRSEGFQHSTSIPSAHKLPITGLAFHPRKHVIATGSDDTTWKLWSIPSGDLILCGEGHDGWLSDIDFNQNGIQLATSSGDCTVKVWDFSAGQCVATLTDHMQPVWGCSWHWDGKFIASSSMDHTAKIWDIANGRCRFTLRGHADSVNSAQFLDQSNILCTSSADKTISLWDARTGLCSQTFYGHIHACNHALFSPQGDSVASCDCYGNVRVWDIRAVESRLSLDLGPHSLNKLKFDPSGQYLAMASNDSTIYLLEIQSGQVKAISGGHADSVLCLDFDHKGEILVSGGADDAIHVWS